MTCGIHGYAELECLADVLGNGRFVVTTSRIKMSARWVITSSPYTNQPDSKQSVDENNVKSRNLRVERRVCKGDHEVVQLKLKYSDKKAGA
ncbi:hypothetical protein ARMGADRAFT_1014601 [Armillaria gallica]|uniref:Uncharacterized protein n=1 Tax=Armillaria gallica TaxID=47427 RepID=A0A2H3D5F7_ARMGA|nr:hypothetical protein ARMGADRAFT_1014601 [Armillaria gallica]